MRATDRGPAARADRYRPHLTPGEGRESEAQPTFIGRWRGYDRHHVDAYVEHQQKLADALRQRALRAEARLGAIVTAGEHQGQFAGEVDLAERRARIEPWQEAEEIVTRLEVDLAERRTRIEPLGPGADPPVWELDDRMGDELATEHGLIPVDPSEGTPTESPVRRVTRRPPRRRSTATGIAATAAVLAAALVWLGLGASGRSVARPLRVVPTPLRPAHAVRRSHGAPVAPALILESAVGKRCWIGVRRGGPTGAVVYQGTLVPGARWATRIRRPLWIDVGWAPNLRVVLGGRVLLLSEGTGEFVVDRTTITKRA